MQEDFGIHASGNRLINYLRISLTDRCNYRCLFCMPKEGRPFIPHEKILRYDELLRLVQIFASLGIVYYKITGGEPFCRKDAVAFLHDLTQIPNVREVSITTNGSLVLPLLPDLAKSGVKRLTFSFISFDPATFQKICRTDVKPDRILQTMDEAASLGFQIKINVVPLAGYNENDLVPIARYALERGYTARFIELMPTDSGKDWIAVPQDQVRHMMEEHFGNLVPVKRKMGNGPAKVYDIAGYSGHLGFIAAMTDKFCASCNRIRLTSQGFLKTCLCHPDGVDLRQAMINGADDAALAELIKKAIQAKPAGHTFSFLPSKQHSVMMNAIGG